MSGYVDSLVRCKHMCMYVKMYACVSVCLSLSVSVCINLSALSVCLSVCLSVSVCRLVRRALARSLALPVCVSYDRQTDLQIGTSTEYTCCPELSLQINLQHAPRSHGSRSRWKGRRPEHAKCLRKQRSRTATERVLTIIRVTKSNQ